MQKTITPRWQIANPIFPALTLGLLLFFTYGIFIRAPYTGFYFNPTNGRVLQIFLPSTSSLRVGDILTKVGNVSWQDYYLNGNQGLFNDVQDGETIDLDVNRDGHQIMVQWKIPGFNQPEFFSRFFNIWWLAYIFWFFGFSAQIFVRPANTRWKLFVASNYLTGLWIILGSLSARHLWESSILLRATTWMLLPIYLHFHLLFPKPLARVPKSLILALYGASLPFILGELTQRLPKMLYALGLMLTLVGIAVLQIVHFIKRPEQRREVGLVALAILLSILPSLALSISGVEGVIPQLAPIGLLTLPFMPLTYLFIFYRNQLGDLEMRANRLLSLYAFMILLGTGLIILVSLALSLQIPEKLSVLFAMATAIVTAVISIQSFPRFQAFVEQRFLGIRLPYQNLQETYSSRITTSTSMSNLLSLLENEVFPSLLVRQFAFLQVLNGSLKVLLTRNVPTNKLPLESSITNLANQSGTFIPNSSLNDEWLRLILPLKIGDNFIGFWLLGRRDPDDVYPLAEIPILQSLANQTAITLSNILQTEQLRQMYQLDIERNELERKRLALDLHDSVLNELAVLRANLDEVNLSAQFKASYAEVTQRLREIVSDLLPPMLMYGLVPAMVELADNLMERSDDAVNIAVDVQSSEGRPAQYIEQHIFRIVQEAWENVLKHANAKSINVHGLITGSAVDLTIEDNGKGFDMDERFDLASLLSNNHFGLAGMVERAHLIEAEITIQSKIETGTTIQIRWIKSV